MDKDKRELSVSRVIDATPDKVFRCWTEPDLICQWFTPPPYKTIKAVLDLRAGGASCITMQSPDGQEMPNPGIFLEVVKNEKLVMTDAYVRAWVPNEKPFMTTILTFEKQGDNQTLYTARVMHWNEEDVKTHEAMGFHEGWGIATDQLAALAKTL